MFTELARIGPATGPDEESSSALQNVPYRRMDSQSEPHPGLRAYPFLAQVQCSLGSLPRAFFQDNFLGVHILHTMTVTHACLVRMQ